VPLVGSTTTGWPDFVYLRPRESVVGLEDVTVVEPISNFVLVVDENRQVATPFTLTGQLANLARLAGVVVDVAPADPDGRATNRDTPTSESTPTSDTAPADIGLRRALDADR
jgi:hypothetical protein